MAMKRAGIAVAVAMPRLMAESGAGGRKLARAVVRALGAWESIIVKIDDETHAAEIPRLFENE